MVNINIIPHRLQFKKAAHTSRNTFRERMIYLLKLWDSEYPEIIGWGEAAPLEKLSIDDVSDYPDLLFKFCEEYKRTQNLDAMNLEGFPSIRFGLETAINDLALGGQKKIFNSEFFSGTSILINGLVWMADSKTMLEEALTKAEQGFDTIKFKVGALDFDEECRMLEAFRKQHSGSVKTIRLDANCAFDPNEALEKINELSRFDIHSIEQPIPTNNWDAIHELQGKGAIDIALDEELIGLDPFVDGQKLLEKTNAPYIILKPNLIGGFRVSDEWVKLCAKNNRAWWATSALEGNVGLNAIAQWVSQYQNNLPQGLGTGSLYSNNFASPLVVDRGYLTYQKEQNWDTRL